MSSIITETLLTLQNEVGFYLSGLYVGDDRVHLLFLLTPNQSLAEVVKKVKGWKEKVLREHFWDLNKLPSLWTSGCWVETFRIKNLAQMKAYLDRKEEHRGRWEAKLSPTEVGAQENSSSNTG